MGGDKYEFPLIGSCGMPPGCSSTYTLGTCACTKHPIPHSREAVRAGIENLANLRVLKVLSVSFEMRTVPLGHSVVEGSALGPASL